MSVHDKVDAVFDTYTEACVFQQFDAITFELAISAFRCLPIVEGIALEKVKTIFDDACKHGLLSERLIEEMKLCVPSKEDQRNIFNHDLEGIIPKNWQRNLKANKRFPHKTFLHYNSFS